VLCHDLERLRDSIAIAGLDHSTIQMVTCVLTPPQRAWAAITYIDPTTHALTKGVMTGFGGPGNVSEGWRFQDLNFACTQKKNELPPAVYHAACA
jgi:hypothetical protein